MSDSPRLLVVDDEARMCASLEKLLSAQGYDVTTHVDPTQALAAIEEEPGFDCVLTDIKMPGVNGLEVLDASRVRDPLAPVILMTGYASLDSAVEAVSRGAYDYLLKPIEFPKLLVTIKRALDKRQSDVGRSELLDRLARQNRALRGRIKELQALHRVGVSISSARPLSDVLEQLLHAATRVTAAEQGSLMLLDEDRRELSIRAAIGLPGEVVASTRLRVGEGISGYVAESGEPVRVANVARDPRFARTPHPRYESRSFLSVPLRISNRILGVLNVSSKQGGGIFRPRDLRVLTIFASQAAALIDDAYHFERHRRQLEEQKVLHRIAHAVATSERFEQVASEIYAALKGIISLDFGLWLGWNEVRGLLHFRFAEGPDINTESWGDFQVEMPPDAWRDEEGFAVTVATAVRDNPAWPPDMHLLQVLPIRLEDRPRGALVFGSRSVQRLTAQELRFAAIACSQAAAVYERHQDALNITRLATMGNMVSEIAHDLKKPLTNLKGSLQLLRQNQPDLARGNPFFESAEQEVHRLGELIRELVQFSNPVRYPLDRVSLHIPLDRALKLIESEVERRRIRLTTDRTTQPVNVRGQEGEIVQALLNVLHNALDSMDGGGTLTVRTYVGRPEGQSEDFAAIAVRDTGCGIPAESRHHVFARHYTTKEGGTGLGLAIVERILRAHNGHVDLSSQPGQGTEITLFFPLAR